MGEIRMPVCSVMRLPSAVPQAAGILKRAALTETYAGETVDHGNTVDVFAVLIAQLKFYS